MIEFLLASPNLIFMSSITIFLTLFVMEITLLCFGISILADSDSEVDYDSGISGLDGPDGPGMINTFANWFGFGRVPLGVLVALFAFVFGTIGLTINFVAIQFVGTMFGALVSVPLTLMGTIWVVPRVATFIGRILPKSESNAIRERDLVGLEGTISIGTADESRSARAVVVDPHGTQHNVMVRTPPGAIQLVENTKITLLSLHDDGYFLANSK